MLYVWREVCVHMHGGQRPTFHFYKSQGIKCRWSGWHHKHLHLLCRLYVHKGLCYRVYDIWERALDSTQLKLKDLLINYWQDQQSLSQIRDCSEGGLWGRTFRGENHRKTFHMY